MIHYETRSQLLYTLLVGATLLCSGISIAWSSAAIPHLITGEIGYTITPKEASWVVSLFSLGCLLSSFYSRFSLDLWGRRPTLLSAGVFYMISWVLLNYANTVWYLYIGRVLAGMGFKISIVACIVYVGEIANKTIRGRLNLILTSMINLGLVIGYIAGVTTSYRKYNYIYAIITCIFYIIAFIFMVESPYFYIKIKNKYAAEKAIQKLKGFKNERHIAEEIEHIERIVQADMKNESSLKDFFTNKRYRKSLCISFTLNIFLTASGHFIIASYIQSIIERVGLNISPKVTPIVYGSLQFLIGIFPAFVLDKFGRKSLLLMSMSGVVISQLSLGAFFYAQSHLDIEDEIWSSMKWIPFAALMLFCFCFNFGVGPVATALEGELYATNVKAVGMALSTVSINVLTIAFVEVYQTFEYLYGLYFPFWIFSLFIICAIAFLALILPETKGKPFDVIQEELNEGCFFRCKYT